MIETTNQNDLTDTMQFIAFRTLLASFINKNYSTCDRFKEELDNCKTDVNIKRVFERYANDVAEILGCNYKDKINDLEDKVSRLKRENEELESELYDINQLFGRSLPDTYKRECFLEHKNNFQAWEFEQLLKNGKEYLKNETINFK